jgi:hypothetical protein
MPNIHLSRPNSHLLVITALYAPPLPTLASAQAPQTSNLLTIPAKLGLSNTSHTNLAVLTLLRWPCLVCVLWEGGAGVRCRYEHRLRLRLQGGAGFRVSE